MKQTLRISSEEIRHRAVTIISALPLEPCSEIIIREYKETRRLIQNDKMWAMLNDISEQHVWYGRKLTTWAWKDIFSASLKQQDVVPGLDGNFVVIGARTSEMKVGEMADMIELMTAFGRQNNIKFKAPKWMEE